MSILEKILKTQEIVTLPVVATKILQLLENENTNTQMIAKLVETDPALSMKIIKVANSAVFAGRTEVSNLGQAIMNLGVNRLTNIILGVSIFSKFMITKNKALNPIVEKYWWHSTSVGVVSKSLCVKLGLNYKEKEFLAGLLHDIGKLVLIQTCPDEYLQAVKFSEDNPEILDLDIEKELFGLTHLDIGMAIAQKWKLPQDIADCIFHHNNAEKSIKNKSLVAIVRISDLLCEMWGANFYEGKPLDNIVNDANWLVVKDNNPKLPQLDIDKIVLELEAEFQRSSEFLSILKA
jgi:putative nucleotidyltransferase with HDIG domain